MSPHARICPRCRALHLTGSDEERECRREHERARERRRSRERGPRFYSTARWQRAREACFRRDGYTCVDCGRHRAELNSHERLAASHVVRPEDGGAIFDLENIETRCVTCHNKRDALARRRSR